MEYNKPNKKAIKAWRISEGIAFIIITLIVAPAMFFLLRSEWDSPWKPIIIIGLVLLELYAIIGLLIFPQIEYKQWGYLVEEDRVVIRHGIFFVKTTIVPIIRIQNITVSQGPINRSLGLYKVEMSLASGSFGIEGLDQETADQISDNLKSRLYARIAEKGVL